MQSTDKPANSQSTPPTSSRRVAFAEVVHVRELDLHGGPMSPTAGGGNLRAAGGGMTQPHGIFRTVLPWDVVREYDTDLRKVDYEKTPDVAEENSASSSSSLRLAPPSMNINTGGSAGAVRSSHTSNNSSNGGTELATPFTPPTRPLVSSRQSLASAAAAALGTSSSQTKAELVSPTSAIATLTSSPSLPIASNTAAITSTSTDSSSTNTNTTTTTAATMAVTTGGNPLSPPSSSAPSRTHLKLIADWHVKADGCIYQGPSEHSSPIGSVAGTVVTTRSGSLYALGRLDTRIAAVMELIAPGSFNPLDPLAPAVRPQLLYAERVVYGVAKDSIAALVAAVAATESALGHTELVATQFSALRSVLATIGISCGGPLASLSPEKNTPAAHPHPE